MIRACTCLLLLLALSACGGGNTSTGPTNTGGPNTAHDHDHANSGCTGHADDGDEEPKPDPDKYRNVSAKSPNGWHALKTPVKKELERHMKPVPGTWKFVSGIVNSEAPGATEPPEKWGEWEKQAAGATLYFVSDREMTPKAAVEAHAKSLAAGEPEIKEGAGIAWTPMQGGEVLVFGISNKHGTYIAVGVVLTTDPEPAREAIRKWVESIKPE